MVDSSKRLIEQWMPINEISTEAIRERAGAVPNPAPNQLHVWWARRPLIASRAAALLSMIPAESDGQKTREQVFKILGTSQDIHDIAERISLAGAIGERINDAYKDHNRAFHHNPTEDQLSWMEGKLVEDSPILLDLTAGGGSIPLEAGRLGFRTIANELNPVACLILRATCEWPQTFGRKLLEDYQEVSRKFLSRVSEKLSDVSPKEPHPDCAGGNCPHPQRYRCTEDCPNPDSCSHTKLGLKSHAGVQTQRDIQTYLWARTVKCPACDGEIPLSPNWRLDNKGTGIRLDADGQQCQFRIVHDRKACPDCRRSDPKKPCNTATLHPDGEASAGTTSRAVAICPQPTCGTTTPKGSLAREAQAGRMGHQLYAVIYRDSWTEKTKAGRDKKRPTTFRGFSEVTPDRYIGEFIETELARLGPQWAENDVLPSEEVPVGNDNRPHTYGMEKWVRMFNPRQQLAHGHCVETFVELVEEDRTAQRLNECRKASWAYVALAIDKLINRNSLLTRWDSGQNIVAGTFDSHDFGFKWSYTEMNLSCQGLGLEWAIKDIRKCLNDLLEMTGHPEDQKLLVDTSRLKNQSRPSRVINSEAQFISELDDRSIDSIVFDPPYHDNVAYAELSDFFYVWLKRTAGYIYPENFTMHLTEKDMEAIASPARFKGAGLKAASAKKLATQDYETKMAEIFAECRRVIKPDGIMSVMFTHKSTAAWDALTVALISEGFSITRTWPVKTEPEAAINIKDRAAARTTILLVCRPRDQNPTPEPWHRVEELIAKEVKDDIETNLSKADLKPIDLYLSAFGPALKVISEHWGTERETAIEDGRTNPFSVTPTDALQVARAEVSRHRAQAISKDWDDSPVDDATRFYILANDANGGAVMEFDEANLLARALGTNLNKQDPGMNSIATFKTDKVSFLSAKDRMAAGNIGENQTPKTNLDLAHTAVALTGRRNTLDAQQWLTQKLYDPQDERFKYTLEALIRTTKPGHDDHQAQTKPLAGTVRRGGTGAGGNRGNSDEDAVTDSPKPQSSNGKENRPCRTHQPTRPKLTRSSATPARIKKQWLGHCTGH